MEFSFVFYLPIGILVAAVLAWIVTVVEKVVILCYNYKKIEDDKGF